MLLLDVSRVVSAERLIEAMWDGEPPATARRQSHNAVAAIRRGFAAAAALRNLPVARGSVAGGAFRRPPAAGVRVRAGGGGAGDQRRRTRPCGRMPGGCVADATPMAVAGSVEYQVMRPRRKVMICGSHTGRF
jgi:hypothetical protein